MHVMGVPPAVIIVVRHGARLDASDKQWHLTSPTPYDPPLTYGGWNQSRVLGVRIANILRSRETDDFGANSSSSNDEKTIGDGRRRRHKVVIHTSPFLRCVQTSIAISSGLAQNTGTPPLHSRPLSSSSAKSTTLYSSPRIRPTLATDSPRLAPILEPPAAANPGDKPEEAKVQIKKSTLRVDAFLGEWLTPDYFELITPPPGSVMMVAGAKADLLRREDYSNLIQVRDNPSPSVFQGFPGGWGSPVVAPVSDSDELPLPSMSSLAQALPRRDRTSSLGSAGSSGNRVSGKILSKTSTANPAEHGVYQPPIPTYAISNSESIPAGYVAHARDACVAVDYQWDSMREPQNWGNGGEYGEEWSSMHKRFRRGLQQLVKYYRDQNESRRLGTEKDLISLGKTSGESDIQDDEDTDLVIILVTHGAGCNALIGALTNQPVLLDVGMASLTMAVCKAPPKETSTTTSGNTSKTHSRNPSRTLTISEEYDVKLVANTEHLRSSTSSTPTSSRAPSIGGSSFVRPFGITNGTTFIDTDRSRATAPSGNFGSIRRTTSAATTPLSRSYIPGGTTSIGLWSAPKISDEEAIEEPGDDMVLNFGDDGSRPSPPSKTESAKTEENGEEDDVPPLGGLWGGPRSPEEGDIIRQMTPKRRWTVNEPGIV